MAKSPQKTKLNRKFLILVGGFVVFAIVVLGGIYYWSYSAAPERNIHLGDALVVEAKAAEAAGDADEAYKKFQQAISRYGRAVSKKPNDLGYSQKMLDTLALMTPKTSGDAMELNRRRDLLLQKRTRAAPLDGIQWLTFINSLSEQADLFPEAGIWKSIAGACDEALGRLPEGEPNILAIRQIRLDALLNLGTVLMSDERAAAETEVAAFLKEFPKNDVLWANLLTYLSADADQLALANRPDESKLRVAEFAAALETAKASNPSSSLLAIAEVQHLVAQRRRKNPLATPGAIHTILDPLLWKGGDTNAAELGTATSLSLDELMTLGDLVVALEDPTVTNRMIVADQAYCDRFPNTLLLMRSIAKLHQSAGQFAEANAAFERVLAAPPPKVSILAAFNDDIRVSALDDMFEIQFSNWQAGKAPAERIVAREALKVARDRLAAGVAGRDGELALIRADAKLAFADGDYLTAVTKLEEVFARDKKVSASLYLVSVISLVERGEQGAALVRVNQAIDEYPFIGQFYYVRARIEASLGRKNDAKRSIQTLLDRDPDDAEAKTLLDLIARSADEGELNMGDPVIKILGDGELLASEGQIDDAIAHIRLALTKYPADLRLRRTICQWLLFAGRITEAQELLANYLVDNPTDTGLKHLGVLSSIPSPVDRVVAFVDLPGANGEQAKPEARAVDLVVGLTNLRENLKQRLKTDSKADKAELELQFAHATTAAQEAIAKAIAVAPGNPVLLDRLYSESLLANNPEQADQLVSLAEKNCKDPAIALLLRGRIELDRKRFSEAVRFFEQAQSIPGASSVVYRLLGFARERAGDVEGAREAYALSYERRPNDPLTVQFYTAHLARSGKTDDARAVLRSAMLAMPESIQIRNAYYDLEALYGSRAGSILERRRMYTLRPAESENARQLMRLLIETAPSRELLLNPDGTERYAEREWIGIGKERQDQELELLGKIQAREATTIFDRLLTINPEDRVTIRVFGAAMQRAGRGEEAQTFFTNRAETVTGPSRPQAWLELAELQLERNRSTEATNSFEQAILLDESVTSDVSRIVSSLWADRNQPARALEVLNAAHAKHPTVDLARLITALRLETRDFAGAKSMSEELEKLGGSTVTFNDRLLAADLYAAELDEAFNKLTPAELTTITGNFNAAMDAAIRLDPASALPFVVRAGTFQRRYQRTGTAEDLQSAKSDIARAIQLQGSYWPATRLLASILVDGGDLPAATHSIRQFVEQSPRNNDARRALMGYQLMAGDSIGAVQTADDAIKIEPRNPIWLQALAEAHFAADLKLDAASDYERIFAITKNPSDLTKAIVIRIMNRPPDFITVLADLRVIAEYANTDPFLQMLGAAAIAGSADNDLQKTQGRVQLREMYKVVSIAKGGLTDQWVMSIASLFSAEESAQMEQFVLDACGHSPDSALCRSMGQQYLELGPAASAKAQEYAVKALSLASNDEEKFNALRVLGAAKYRANHFAEAAAAFEESLTIHPEDLAALNNLAFLEAAYLNKASQSVERARRAFAVNLANADLMDTLGFALFKIGELPEAITLLRRASRAQPSAIVFAHLAAAQLAAGRRGEAVESLNRAKALRFDPEAQRAIDELTKTLGDSTGG